LSTASPRRRAGGAGPSLLAAGLLAALAAGLILTGAGCAGSNPYPPGSFERGVHYAERGKDLEAVAAFESFVRNNPTDSLAAEAQYLKAMTYMEMREYPLAAVEFQILRKDYPTSSRIEDALFQEGRAYLFQVGRVERDITGAYEARLHFLDFSQRYPDSPHMPEVVAHMQEISDLMVEKRLRQVHVYRQLKRYEAIAIVLDALLADEAGSSLIPRVMWERAEVALRLDDPDTAAEMYERLIQNYADSRYANRAQSALRRLDEGDETEDG
jgi:outer membrane protein assembly factor BamD